MNSQSTSIDRIYGDSSPHRVKFGFFATEAFQKEFFRSFEQTKITVHAKPPTVHLRQFISDNLSSVIHFETIKLQTNDTRAIHIQIIHLRKFISDNSSSTLHLQKFNSVIKKTVTNYMCCYSLFVCDLFLFQQPLLT
jgi:hypothetical protein